MKTSLLLCALVSTIVCGCGEKQGGAPAATNSASPITAPVDYLGAVHQGQQRAITVIDTATITQAIQLFQTEHDRLPKDLNELVQERYLAKIPEAPYGSKIVYDPRTGQVKIVKQ